MDYDWANIGLICLLMGFGIGALCLIIAVFLAAQEFLETFYLD